VEEWKMSSRYMEEKMNRIDLRALTHDLNRLYRYASAVWVLVDAGDIQEHIGWKMIGDMQVKLAIDDELVDHKLLGSINSPGVNVVHTEQVKNMIVKKNIRNCEPSLAKVLREMMNR
jgi:hypothetical protein